MTQYHIAANGEAARCAAQPGNCPLGGRHFGTKDEAEFYKETFQSAVLDAATTLYGETGRKLYAQMLESRPVPRERGLPEGIAEEHELNEDVQQLLGNSVEKNMSPEEYQALANKHGNPEKNMEPEQVRDAFDRYGYNAKFSDWDASADEILPASAYVTLAPEGTFDGVSDDELIARQKALTSLTIAQAYGEPSDVEKSLQRLRDMGHNSFDPTWDDRYVQAEFVRRNVLAEAPAEPTELQKIQAMFADMDDKELGSRLKALTKVEFAEQFGDDEAESVAKSELRGAGQDIFDPTWDLPNVQAEFLRRNVPAEQPDEKTASSRLEAAAKTFSDPYANAHRPKASGFRPFPPQSNN